jgi:hypothetical protein
MTHAISGSVVVGEWYRQLAAASKTPGLVQHLVRRMDELLPRFAAYYRLLRSLPRRFRRTLARCRSLSFAGVALLLALCGGPAHPATISVDDATCRLADAIVSANTDSATNGCVVGSGADLILLDTDVTLAAPLPPLTSVVTIQAGLASVIDGAGNACLDIALGGDVVLDGVTVRNCASGMGGGVVNRGTLAVLGSTISGNIAGDGGGGISSWGPLAIRRSVVSDNVGRRGGGLNSYYATVTVSDTTISGNRATLDGGGISNYGGTIVLVDSTISGNSAPEGAGVITGFYCEWCGGVPGSLDIRGSTISGNTATVGGGGGILVYQRGAVSMTTSTISGNQAAGDGGGLLLKNVYEETYLTVVNSTISGNSAVGTGGGVAARPDNSFLTPITLKHVLVSGNAAPTEREMSLGSTISVSADDFNLFGSNGDAGIAGFTPGPTDIVPAAGVTVDDILAPLADNGGPTATHALVYGSPAVDAVPTTDPDCLGTVDQRGSPRPAGAGCDVGSFELGARPHVEGTVTGLAPRAVLCRNKTTGQTLKEKTGIPSWDCEAMGLVVEPGHTVETSASGIVDTTDAHVGGSVVGITPTTISCRNLATGQRVRISTSATSWDCEALGLLVSAGNKVETGVLGRVDTPPAGRGR